MDKSVTIMGFPDGSAGKKKKKKNKNKNKKTSLPI